jgi:hypothetical protein
LKFRVALLKVIAFYEAVAGERTREWYGDYYLSHNKLGAMPSALHPTPLKTKILASAAECHIAATGAFLYGIDILWTMAPSGSRRA